MDENYYFIPRFAQASHLNDRQYFIVDKSSKNKSAKRERRVLSTIIKL